MKKIFVKITYNNIAFKLIGIFLFFFYFLFAQAQVFTSLEFYNLQFYTQLLQKNNPNHFTFLKPYTYYTVQPLIHENSDSVATLKRTWLYKKIFTEPFILIDSSKYLFQLDPLFDFSYEKEFHNTSRYFKNIRGIWACGHLNKRLFYETSVIECQSSFPLYLHDYNYSSGTVPGIGQARYFKENVFDYAASSGIIGIKFTQHFFLSLGQGKFFMGDGYRSLLLSDVAPNYPFLQILVQLKKFKFSQTWTTFLSDTTISIAYAIRPKRTGHFSTISYLPSPKIEISFFEGTIFNNSKLSRKNYIFIALLHPIPTFSSLMKNENSLTNTGINLRINPINFITLYYQLSTCKLLKTTISENNIAYQLGIKLATNNVLVQFEHNRSGNINYQDIDPMLNYSHFNQPLAHLLGNNFKENMIILAYKKNHFMANIQFIRAQYGNKDVENIPKKSRYIKELEYYAPFIGQGYFTQVKYINSAISYCFNKHSKRIVTVGITRRIANVKDKTYNNYFYYVSLKTRLLNFYTDF